MNKKKFFEIAAVHRDDVKAMFPGIAPEVIDGLSDETMEHLARGMHDSYLLDYYWQQIRIIGEILFEGLGIKIEKE